MPNKHLYLSILATLLLVNVYCQNISIRIMTMNIKEGGKYASFDASAFANCIKTYHPDFVVFQELDNYTTRNGNQDMLAKIAVELGYFPYFGRAITYASGDVGNGILSRYPFYNAHNITSKPSGASEERACTWLDVVLPNKRKVRIGVTHLDVANDQVRISSLAIFNSGILTNNTIPTILAGDFNASPSSETMNYAFLKWQDIGTGTGFTIPSTGPTTRIDYILGYPKSWKKQSYEIVAYPELSDHCFVVANVEFD